MDSCRCTPRDLRLEKHLYVLYLIQALEFHFSVIILQEIQDSLSIQLVTFLGPDKFRILMRAVIKCSR